MLQGDAWACECLRLEVCLTALCQSPFVTSLFGTGSSNLSSQRFPSPPSREYLFHVQVALANRDSHLAHAPSGVRGFLV